MPLDRYRFLSAILVISSCVGCSHFSRVSDRLQGDHKLSLTYPTGSRFYEDGPGGTITTRRVSTHAQLFERVSGLRVWRRNRRIVGLQIQTENDDGREWKDLIGRDWGAPEEVIFESDETLLSLEAITLSDEDNGIYSIRVTTLPISGRYSGAKTVVGDFELYTFGDWPIAIDTDSPRFHSDTFFESDGGYPLSEIAGFRCHLAENGSISSIGVIRQHTPKHNEGYGLLVRRIGSAGAIGEDPLEYWFPGKWPVNRIGNSIRRVRSWVDPVTNRISGVRFDWHDNTPAMIIGTEGRGRQTLDYEIAYDTGVTRIWADFDRSGFLVHLNLRFREMRKPNSNANGTTVSLELGSGNVSRRDAEVESLHNDNNQAFYELLIKGEADRPIRGFDVVTRPAHLLSSPATE